MLLKITNLATCVNLSNYVFVLLESSTNNYMINAQLINFTKVYLYLKMPFSAKIECPKMSGKQWLQAFYAATTILETQLWYRMNGTATSSICCYLVVIAVGY